jgi:hypothetical protein
VDRAQNKSNIIYSKTLVKPDWSTAIERPRFGKVTKK